MKTVARKLIRAIDPFYFYLGIGTFFYNYYILAKFLIEHPEQKFSASIFEQPEVLALQGGETILLSLFALLASGRLGSFRLHLKILGFLSPFLTLALWPFIGGSPFASFFIGFIPGLFFLFVILFIKLPTPFDLYEKAGPRWLNYFNWLFRLLTAVIYWVFLHLTDFATGALLVIGAAALMSIVLSIVLFYRYNITKESISRGYIVFAAVIFIFVTILPLMITGGLEQNETAAGIGSSLFFVILSFLVKKLFKNKTTPDKP